MSRDLEVGPERVLRDERRRTNLKPFRRLSSPMVFSDARLNPRSFFPLCEYDNARDYECHTHTQLH